MRHFEITSIEARLYDAQGPATSNIIDNPVANLQNVEQSRLKISVTVTWAPHDTTTIRMDVWARANGMDGREMFDQEVTIAHHSDSASHVQEFWISGVFCKPMLIRASAWAPAGTFQSSAEVFRLIPFVCGE